MSVVLDSCALIAFLRDEEGADVVEAALVENNCAIHAVNMGEVYKDCLVRGENSEIADGLLEEICSTGLVVREDLDEDLWKHAATLKAEIRPRIAYADCFALAITSRMNATLYTSDHHELDHIADEGQYKIHFIR